MTDLDGLRLAFDSNLDGVFDANDTDWSKFRVWQDADQDGETDDGELQTLAEAGITSFDLTSDNEAEEVGSNYISGRSTYTTAGGTAEFADVTLATSAFGYREKEDGSLDVRSSLGDEVYLDGRFSDLVLDLGESGYFAAFSGDGADVLSAGSAADVLLDGGEGDDTLTGGTGADWLVGGAGADVISGGDGADILFFDADDTISGGDGFDIAFVDGPAVEGASVAGVTLDLTATGFEAVFGNDGVDVFSATGTEDVYLDGGAGDDTLAAGDGADVLIGGDGADSLSAGNGDDTLFVDAADLAITGAVTGGDGRDTLVVQDTAGVTVDMATLGVEVAFGGDGNDTLNGGTTNDVIWGGAGNDTLAGGVGSDAYIFTYGSGSDVIDDASTDEDTDTVRFNYDIGRFSTLFDKSGDDLTVTLSGSTDTLTVTDWFSDANKRIDRFDYLSIGNGYAFVGDDGVQNWTATTDDHYFFWSFGANDSLTGAAGHDILVGGAGADALTGGEGSDTAGYQTSSAGVSVDLAAGTATGGDAEGDTLSEIENLYGSEHSDTLTGDAEDNILTGAGGDDVLTGAAGGRPAHWR